MKEKREKISFKESIPISKLRFWAGLVISIFLSFFLYQFFILGRDIFRSYTFTTNFNYLEFTENELLFYNLFYAFLALIIAQTFFLKIIFDTNKKLGEKRIQFYRKKVVHNQNLLIWFFLFCFIKLAVFYGIMNMNSLYWGDYTFSIYECLNFVEEYPYLFLLIILVLFLQSWQSLRVILHNYLKYMIGSFVFISIVAFAFSKINLVDFESYFKKQHAENPYIKENIELPNIHFTKALYSWNKKIDLYVSKNGEIYLYGKKINLSELRGILIEINNGEYRYDNFRSFVQLNIDKNTPIKHLYKLKKIINTYSYFKIAYSAYPENLKFSKTYYQDKPIGVFEGSKVESFKNEITLELTNRNEILLNKKRFNCKQIADTISQQILSNKDYSITFKLKENALFSDYIKLLSYAREGYFKAIIFLAKEKEIDPFFIYNESENILYFMTVDIDDAEIIDKLKIPLLNLEDD